MENLRKKKDGGKEFSIRYFVELAVFKKVVLNEFIGPFPNIFWSFEIPEIYRRETDDVIL